jgi:nucleoid DNA-binding protein
MPKLYQKKCGNYYTRVPVDDKIATFQIDAQGVKILQTLGFNEGNNFDIENFWRLHSTGHTYTYKDIVAQVPSYGGEKLIAKPEGLPDVRDPEYGPGWIHDRKGSRIHILFKDKDGFTIRIFDEKMYRKHLSENFNQLVIKKLAKTIKSEEKAIRAFNCIFDSIIMALASHETVGIKGFGSFHIKRIKQVQFKNQKHKNNSFIRRQYQVKFRSSMPLD